MAWTLQPPTPVWRSTPPPGITPPVTALSLAITAIGQLTYPTPNLNFAPKLALGETIVQANTWYWITTPLTLTPPRTTAGTVWAQLHATATLTINPGDNTGPITCTGPGTPLPPGTNPATAASPTCGHIYTHTGPGQPGQTFPATITTTWTITYTGTDTPMPQHLTDHTTTQNTPIPVGQIEAEIVPQH